MPHKHARAIARKYSMGGRTRVGLSRTPRSVPTIVPEGTEPGEIEAGLNTTRELPQLIPDRGYKLPKGKRWRARVAGGGRIEDEPRERAGLVPESWEPKDAEDYLRTDTRQAPEPSYNPLEGMDPIELLKLRMQGQYHAPSAKSGWETAEEVAGMLPVTGNILSAKDAIEVGGSAYQAAREGDWKRAGIEGGVAGLSALGALSPLPWGRTAGKVAKEAGNTAAVFLPIGGKVAERAREMRGNDASLEDVLRETGAFFSHEGRPMREVLDRNITLRPTSAAPGDRVPLSEIIDHPELFAERPHYRDIPVHVTDLRTPDGRPHVVSKSGSREFEMALEGGHRGDLRGDIAKILQYRLARDYGLSPSVRHGKGEVGEAVADTMMRASASKGADIDALAAFYDRAQRVADRYRSVVEGNGPTYLPADALMAKHLSGNVTANTVMRRATFPDVERYHPFSRPKKMFGTKTRQRPTAFNETLPLISRQATPTEVGQTINEWRTFGGGRGGFHDVPERFARGGRVSSAVRRARALTVGAVRGKTGGREDALPVTVPAGAYVIPADVVSALGEGNTEAGMAQLQAHFARAKSPSGYNSRASGGRVAGVPILISDGEFVVTPHQAEAVGGHDALDKFVLTVRQAFRQHLANLPGPNQ